MAKKNGLQDAILRAVQSSPKCKPHLVTKEKSILGKDVLTAHVATGLGTAKDRRSVLSALRKADTGFGCRLNQHRQNKIEGAQTLEDFVARYGDAEIVFDPTQVVSRTRALVSLAKDIRSAFSSEELVGTYWDAVDRTAYIVLDPTTYFTDKMIKGADIHKAEECASAAIRTYLDNENCVARDVLLSFEFPASELVPVDAESFFDLGDVTKSKNGRVTVGLASALVGAFAVTSVAAEPAVSNVNSKFSLERVSTSSTTFGNNDATIAAGSVTVPLGEQFGLQLDGAVGSLDGDNLKGLGGHLFWRDPSVAMVGLTFGAAEFDRGSAATDQSVRLVGLEGEYYLGDFTLFASLGRQSGTNILEGNYGSVGFGWYATDDLQIRLDVSTSPDVDSAVSLGVEWQPAFGAANNLSVFADASSGSDGFESVNFGFRMYFGGSSKPLTQRHRFDDPQDNIPLKFFQTTPNSAGGGTPKGKKAYIS